MIRRIQQVVTGVKTSDGAGVSLTRIIGQPALPRLDPFLMLDEFGSDQPSDYLAGFPPHPHRGFQTVTYMLAGRMGHADSVGNQGVIETGGLQWMNAGRGIIHEEMPRQTDGLLRGFQLWVNLPADEKMSAPGYQDIPSQDVTELEAAPGIRVRVLAGEFRGIAGPVNTQAVKPLFLDVLAAGNGELSIPLEASHNAFVYCYEGKVTVAGQPLFRGQLAVLDKGSTLSLDFDDPARLILVAAKPIGEPVVQYGPFVMNSEEEIRQAVMDYQSGRFTD
ncbi:pirin family protein [Bowmanella dokdonensis]|uniref:Pirin family protein n=1 Tax=Bowmanella dokdonensis TaxID=751969 RepID=A0A939IQ00_9ALTE|nr:pirin family protein [Bowmanella dokdonensis]MBN7824519.1 pirin family protein [Bowmanella dokdonensis]